MSKEFSLIIPCHNEAENIPRVGAEITKVFGGEIGNSWEVIFIDDGSWDPSLERIRELNGVDNRFKAIVLSRNFGHQPALSKGLEYAQGQWIGVIDCDLQDPVEVLVELYKKAKHGGYDVAYGIRRNREAPIYLKFCYYLFYRMLSHITDHQIPQDSGDFCVMSRRALDLLLSLPEKQRFLRGLRAWIGLKQTGVPYDRPKRREGTTKYNFWRLLRLAISGFTGFSLAPLRLASFMGFLCSLLAVALAALFAINRFFPNIMPFGYYIGTNPGTTTLVLLLLGAFAGVFLCLGIIGEYLAVVINEVKGRPGALVGDTLGIDDES